MKRTVLFIFLLSVSVQAQIIGGNFFSEKGTGCGALLSPGYFRKMMCHNLGADTTLDPNIPTQALHGDYYQWGQRLPSANSTAIIGAWNAIVLVKVTPDWADQSKGIYDPCPKGFRVPTQAQWKGIIDSNPFVRIGSWASDGNFTSVLRFGSVTDVVGLSLPAAGFRTASDGSLQKVGGQSSYWSSTQDGAANAYVLNADLTTNPISTVSFNRNQGANVRCIEEIKCVARMGRNPDVFKEFMCHNLGADTTLDPNLFAQNTNGFYYHWGKKAHTGTATGGATGVTGTLAVDGSWSDSFKTVNDPCPSGFRVPTKLQWEAVADPNNNSTTKIGPWTSFPLATSIGAFLSGTQLGSDANSKWLSLPNAGYRSAGSTIVFFRLRGTTVNYWSSTVAPSATAVTNPSYLSTVATPVGSSALTVTTDVLRTRIASLSVRCIAEDSKCVVRMAQNPDVYKEWMCHNLGSDTNLDYNDPVAGIHGDYFQWGKKIAVATANPAAVLGWDASPIAINDWESDGKSANDPCPGGFRVPKKAQWDAAIANNTLFKTGSWEVASGNFTSAIHLTSDNSSISLTLPAAGYRLDSSGALSERGSLGTYWTSTQDAGTSTNAYVAELNGNAATANLYAATKTNTNATGASVRCIAENIKCGAFTAPGVFREFMCHNLGADQSLDPDIVTKGIYGDYYKWGTKVPSASVDGVVLNTVPYGTSLEWGLRGPQKGPEDPCPFGFKIPLNVDWNGVVANNILTRIGIWETAVAGNINNFGAATRIEPGSNYVGLTLPTAGMLESATGTVTGRGYQGVYWSSQTSNVLGASAFINRNFLNSSFPNGVVSLSYAPQDAGGNVRCIAE